ncbi:glycosyltransferase [Novosphingobium sp. FSY-8]|uniref:Chitooligosaccharide deacetylase n=1 Tax=Novosphingobium ovatum TaxID=1908523 RepID=A0ABW9X9J7_9SPHN|nr:glycosyltransferase [Novosphingobium ovatum]NBC35201.1 glycosyltransferase [Novosphingobium ovatum]
MAKAIFFDPSGKRRKRTRRLIFAGLLALLVAAIAFASTVVSVPAPAPLPIEVERRTPLRLRAQVSNLSHAITRLFQAPPRNSQLGPKSKPITVGFYPTWSETSALSLARNINQLDWVAPTTMSLTPSGHLSVNENGPMRRIIHSSLHRPLVMSVFQNTVDESFNAAAGSALLRSSAKRRTVIAELRAYLARNNDGGVIFDFEDLKPEDMPLYRDFIGEAEKALNADGRITAVTLMMQGEGWSPADFAKVADKIILMAYDEHWMTGTPGPIASNGWFAQKVANATRGIPTDKVIVALGSYAYDWHGEKEAQSLTIEEALLSAHDSSTMPVFDKASGNTGFSFLEDDKRHDVWLLDAAASWNQMRILKQLGLTNIALWRLGSEDPGFWTTLRDWRRGANTTDISTLAQKSNVDVQGQGELVHIAATPTEGKRQITQDPRTHLITDMQYTALPTPYQVRRNGARDKMVVLTFDDGPDPIWTPRILDILEQYKAPATFFVIGENALPNRALLQRMVASGMELGNHSYTHPNMALSTETAISLELNATQRLVEAYTGRSMRLFRAPYFGDAEPTTADELVPASIAQAHGYTVVGLHVDPDDWKRPGAQAIVDRTLRQVMSHNDQRSENIILLHDGGGDRAQTVAALPGIIVGLRNAGYKIVTVAELAGLKRDQVMPPLEGYDLAVVRADVFAFWAISTTVLAVNWTFFFAIFLGVFRSVSLVVLALLPSRRSAPAISPDFQPTVTVIIPCFNEEKVIEASVRRILESDYPNMDVIVADDGSKDRTSAIVAEHFGDHPRVRLMTMPNGGKAAALNAALQLAVGEIIVALDADTHFERETISRLVRWFTDPKIGAVAGNAKVGNRVNLVTRWQAVEYVTAQNIERKALTRLDAIMVVPGAVGAWRRRALVDVGGYPENTLAEDQDLTIAIQRKKWKVAYDEDAVAWTEAPETFRALAKQRFRWSYGTLQCLWKHRKVMWKGKPSGLAFVGIPQAWLFQILFACISPAIDLALLISILGTITNVIQHGWAQTETDLLRMTVYWLAFSSIDAVCGWIAYRLDVRGQKFPLFLLLAQRFVYRQLMYSVVLRAVSAAIHGVGTGWGKLERTGRVSTQPEGKAIP